MPEIDLMTMSDFERLSRYWQKHPPLHLMVAGYLGIKPRKPDDEADMAELLRMFGGDESKTGTHVLTTSTMVH